MTAADSTDRPPPDQVLVDMADYAVGAAIESPAAYETARLCLMDSLGCALLALGDPGLPQAAGARGSGGRVAGRGPRARNRLGTRPGPGRLQHRRHDPLARLQRHLAGRRVGPPSDNLGAILACADWVSRRRGGGHGDCPSSASDRPSLLARVTAASRPRRADGHDQGLRDPRGHRPGERLQPGGARSRAAGPRGQRGRGHGPAGRIAPAGPQRDLERLDRRRLPADLPPRAQHGVAEVLGGRRRHQPRRAAGALGHAGRDGLSHGARRSDVGLLRRAAARPAAADCPALRELRHRARAVQGGLPGRVPRPNGRRSRHPAARPGARPPRPDRTGEDRDAAAGHADHRQARAALQSGRPRSLPSIHGRRGAAGRHAARRSTTGTSTPGTRGSTGCARKWRWWRTRNTPATISTPSKRSIANAVQVFFADGSATPRVEVEYPLGHPRRRGEAIPQLEQKFLANAATRLPEQQCRAVLDLFRDGPRLESLPVDEFMAMFAACSRHTPCAVGADGTRRVPATMLSARHAHQHLSQRSLRQSPKAAGKSSNGKTPSTTGRFPIASRRPTICFHAACAASGV